MTCRNCATGELESYDRFKEEALRPRRTEKAQRKELRQHIDELTEQGDWWSLDTLRKLSAILADDRNEAKAIDIRIACERMITPGSRLLIGPALAIIRDQDYYKGE